nr:MAG TPA: hypothetical protein [Caudoviricetes sp.]
MNGLAQYCRGSALNSDETQRRSVELSRNASE